MRNFFWPSLAVKEYLHWNSQYFDCNERLMNNCDFKVFKIHLSALNKVPAISEDITWHRENVS